MDKYRTYDYERQVNRQKGDHRCLNQRKGGEDADFGQGPYFVYVVWQFNSGALELAMRRPPENPEPVKRQRTPARRPQREEEEESGREWHVVPSFVAGQELTRLRHLALAVGAWHARHAWLCS